MASLKKMLKSVLKKKKKTKKKKKMTKVKQDSYREEFWGALGEKINESMSHEATELFQFIINDGDLYRRQTTPIINNLKKKIAKGNFDKQKSIKLWGYLAESGAKAYHKEFGDLSLPWNKLFPVKVRKEVAVALAEYFDEDINENETMKDKLNDKINEAINSKKKEVLNKALFEYQYDDHSLKMLLDGLKSFAKVKNIKFQVDGKTVDTRKGLTSDAVNDPDKVWVQIEYKEPVPDQKIWVLVKDLGYKLKGRVKSSRQDHVKEMTLGF